MPTKKYLHNIDLAQNQLISAVIENRSSAPSNAIDGQLYYNTVDKKVYTYNGTQSSWGTVASQYVETDPIYTASSWYTTTNNSTNWNTAYGWGNHASAGYLTTTAAATTYQPLDADLSAIAALTGTTGLLKKNAADSWSLDTNTYLTSYTETDPVFTASAASGITSTNITNWNTAYGWGNHASAGYQLTSAKGVANGYASLDSGGKVPVAQLPSSIMEYKGVWNASTNTPTLANGTGDTGDVYRVSVAGSQNLGSGSITFDVGDYVIYNGTTWEKSDTTDAVASVNGLTGVVVLSTTNISEGTNLYYTDTRARASISSSATGLTYTNSTGVFSFTTGYAIPTTASQTNWDTAFTERRYWDGGATGLVAATGRTSLGATTVGANIFTLTNPSAITFIRINADNTVSTLDAATFRSAIGAGTSSTSGTVTTVSVTTANGVSGSVATATTTPAITITLGAITPSTVNGLTFTAAATGFTIAGGTTSKTLTVSNTLTLAGTDSSTLNIGAGGTLGSAAFTASTAYQASNTNLTSLAGLSFASTSFVKMTAAGTFSLDTNIYLTSAVTTISFGTTGLTPNTGTSGAVTVAGTLVAANGGTGQSSYTIGDILYASTTTALSKLAAVAAGSYLRSAGTGTAPVWSTVTIPNAAVLGDIWYGSAANAVSSLAGNTTTTKQYLSQTGNGTVSAAPVWSAIAGSDVTGAALTKTDDTNVTLTLGGTPATALLRAASFTLGWTGQLAATRGGTGLGTYVLGDILYASAANTLSALAGNTTTTRKFLRQTGITTASAAPVWDTILAADIPGSALTKTDDTNVTLTLGGSASTALLNAASLTLGWTGTLAVSRGGTGAGTLTGVVIGNGTGAMTAVSSTTALQVLRVNAGGNGYEFATISTGGGSVTSVSVVTANGISGTVATASTTPAITLTLGAITPTSVNGLTFTAAATGFTIAGGTTSKTLTVSNTLTLAGTDASTLNIGSGGTLGSAAFTASTAYQASSTNLTSLAGLTFASTSFVKMTAAGTFALDTNTYLTAAITSIGTSGNQQTGATQTLAVGTTGTDFNISSATNTHTFNIPDASATARGLVTIGTQTFNGNKTFQGTLTYQSFLSGSSFTQNFNVGAIASVTLAGVSSTVSYNTAISPASGGNINISTGNNLVGLLFNPGNQSVTESTTGTHNLIASVALKPWTITDAAATTTNGATLYIENAVQGTATITNNYAVWVDDGTVRLDGAFELQGIANTTETSMLYYNTTTKRVTYGALPSGAGTVTTVSVVSANGFAGTVATASSTPAITLTTTITGVLKGNGTAISAAVANTDYLAVASPVYTGVLSTGTLSFTPANHFMALATSSALYNQLITQNTSNGAAASNDIVVNNNISSDTANYGDYGINSSNYAGSGSFSLANAVYLYAHSGDLAIGTYTSNAIHFVVNNGATDAATIKTTGQFQLPGYTSTSSFSGTAAGFLAFDSSGNVITVSAPSSGYSVASVSTTYSETATSGTKIIKATTTGGTFTITLPTAVGNTATLIIKKVAGTPALTIDGAGTETIDGALTATLNKVDESITLISDNTNWFII